MRFLDQAFVPFIWWSTDCCGGAEKGENAQAGWDLYWGSSLAASHSKGGTAAKSSRLRRVYSGLAAKTMFRLFRSGLVKIPNAFAYLPFFLSQLSLVLLLFLVKKSKTTRTRRMA